VPDLQSRRAAAPGVYRPEYIELRITGNAGGVHGRYRARYRVPDQAISPVVAFEFRGQPDAGALNWNGSGGSSGEIKLRLLSGGTMEVSWVATSLGEELGLISGTATLVRKLE
jgi:hypothetical protein